MAFSFVTVLQFVPDNMSERAGSEGQYIILEHCTPNSQFFPGFVSCAGLWGTADVKSEK